MDLFFAWLRIGLFSFVGGPSVIPLVRAECVERFHWMTDEQLLDALAFGNSLPGPIAVKLAAYIGLQVGGPLGCVAALLGLCMPGIAMMLGLGALYGRYREAPMVAGAMRGLRPAMIGLLAFTVWTLAPDGVRDWKAGVLAGASFLALVLHVHPAIVVAVAIVGGAVLLRF